MDNFEKKVKDVMNQIDKAYFEKVRDVLEVNSVENDVLVIKSKLPPKFTYLVKFFKADDAGTIGMKLKLILGIVYDIDKVTTCLNMNVKVLLDKGPLFAAVEMVDNDALFMLVGQMIFPPNTPAEEIATLFYFQAFLSYSLFDEKYPGVNLFQQ